MKTKIVKMESRVQFQEYIESCFEQGAFATDDVIAFVLPVFKEVLGFHEEGKVGPFHLPISLFVNENVLDIDENLAISAKSNLSAIEQLFRKYKATQFEVADREKFESDDEGYGFSDTMDLYLGEDADLKDPAFIKGYRCYELLFDHHDALTDIFSLGLILASVSMGLDLNDEFDLKVFVRNRKSPTSVHSSIHPTIASLITEMTELDRSKRSKDLYEIIRKLEHYREYDVERQLDLSKVNGWKQQQVQTRSQFILTKLRNRLFDTSRRNRLLYYKSNMRFVNLTVSSVPIVLHYQSIRPDLLFTWNEEISSKVIGMKEMVLNKYLRFEDHPYIASSLDKIRSESQRDVQEYGFSQLKMVVAFLNWHNLKEDIEERIQSPLLLVSVALKKNKKLKEDHYVLEVLDNTAEVNPVLANQLRDLYGIQLPDFVDLDEMKLESFYQLIKKQIDGANQGIQLKYIDKPRIRLIHSVARQTVTNFKRRLRPKGQRTNSYLDVEYSYDAQHYKPLGLELYRQRVEPNASFLQYLIDDAIKLQASNMAGDAVKTKELYELMESDSNPYSWDFDTCNMVLGNFNYKKMSLVRDYNSMVDEGRVHEVFEELFSEKPKKYELDSVSLDEPEHWHHVITADPTQTKAILNSRTGKSYIIQGPPGTGKSQTITNLIADYLALGKTVLFVCEKRAALDVVFHRLKQAGLDELCCYIHDSQNDKKSFIMGLKETYEDFSTKQWQYAEIVSKRNEVLAEINEHIGLLKHFHLNHLKEPATIGMSLRAFIDRLVSMQVPNFAMKASEKERLPDYAQWKASGEVIKNLAQALEDLGAEPIFSEHPFGAIKTKLWTEDRPIHLIETIASQCRSVLQQIQQVSDKVELDAVFTSEFQKLKGLVQDAVLLAPLAQTGQMDLIDANSFASKGFENDYSGYQKAKKDQQEALEHAANWKEKWNRTQVEEALRLASDKEGKLFSFFSGAWRKLKQQIQETYDFNQHTVKPRFTEVLTQLKEWHDRTAKTESIKQGLEQKYRLSHIDTAYLGIEQLRKKKGDPELDYLMNRTDGEKTVLALEGLQQQLNKLELDLQQLLFEFKEQPLAQLGDLLESIEMNAESVMEMLPILKQVSQLPQNVQYALAKIPLEPTALEALVASYSYQQYLQADRMFQSTDMLVVERSVQKLKAAYEQLMQLNALYIRASIRKNFHHNIEKSNTAISQLNTEERQFKKDYNEGRKLLENEFGKSMRYKSIRELATKESGLVLKDLKPVWLMSPLSVSDSLPLDEKFFDVVIFDEASQITLEEGIPALFRSQQSIIVGDDKQMPPTNFFSTKAEDPDDLSNTLAMDEDEVISDDADSLLVQGARKLPSSMLSWHYRSHYETLISYSNHAFYQAGLLTIPDTAVHQKELKELIVEDAAQINTDALFDRSISYHYLPKSIYEKRANLDEAKYIAHMVRDLLKRKREESIAIVAFSQEQQQTIEDALTDLAATDREFEQLLEEAYERTEQDQFVGLIVKNLENIQGDERDIVIMSVCYGFDANKRMIMNFGPINKKGGEKRLNVLFSRAKKHMAVVSSIQHHHITNEYNEGANYFKRFLHYAASVSKGELGMARQILGGLVLNKKSNQSTRLYTAVLDPLKKALELAGWDVATHVGQSDFKASIAIREPGADKYVLTVLIDDDFHYNNENIVEQYFQRPALLRSFGWKCLQIFAKDWLQDPSKVLQKIDEALKNDSTEELSKPALSEFVVNIAKAETSTDENWERYVAEEEGKSKFWEVSLQGTKLLVRFGKLGSKGQTQVKNFPNEATAVREKDKLVREKVNKGYQRT